MTKTIFLVDDEPELLAALRRIIEHDGYDVQTAPSGDALFTLLDRKRPDLVILDIGLPGMDGWEVRRRMREDPRLATIPVIALTAAAGSARRDTAIATLGFADYLEKPLSGDELLDRVRSVLA